MEYIDLIENDLIEVGQICFTPAFGAIKIVAILENKNAEYPIKCLIIDRDYDGSKYINFTKDGKTLKGHKYPTLYPREGVAHWNDEKPIKNKKEEEIKELKKALTKREEEERKLWEVIDKFGRFKDDDDCKSEDDEKKPHKNLPEYVYVGIVIK